MKKEFDEVVDKPIRLLNLKQVLSKAGFKIDI